MCVCACVCVRQLLSRVARGVHIYIYIVTGMYQSGKAPPVKARFKPRSATNEFNALQLGHDGSVRRGEVG